jgi:hypothetical protein
MNKNCLALLCHGYYASKDKILKQVYEGEHYN